MSANKVSRIALYSILFLFFFQLIADFIEAVYAFGLLSGGLPPEMVSVLFLFSPAILVFLRKGLSGWPLVLVGELMLVCRVVEPLLDTRGRMLVAGLGVACFLILLPMLITRRQGATVPTRGLTLGMGLTLGLSLSVVFRALHSGNDLSTYGWFQAIGWVLALVAAALLLDLRARGDAPASGPVAPATGASEGRGQPGFWRTVGLALGAISVLILLYFSLTSPNVIARWTGASYLLVVGAVVLVLSLCAILLATAPRLLALLRPGVVLLWNVLFVLSMVLAIAAHQIRFPADVGGYPLAEPAVTPLHYVPLLLMLVLSPVVLVDFALYSQELAERRPSSRRLGGAFTLASLYFLLVVFGHIFTTVYDYIPVVGPFFRDKFWLVYLVVGVTLAFPVLLVRRSSFNLEQAARRLQLGPVLPGLVVLISVVTVAAVLFTAANPAVPPGPQRTLKILTYNIQQGYSREGLRNYDGQLVLMRQVDADIIGLQESDTNRIAGGNADVVRYFADRLDMYAYYGPKTVVGTFGIALLSKYPIENPRTFYMYGEGEQTATVEAQIGVGDRIFRVFVTHLGSEEPEPPGNMPQQEAILKEVAGKGNVILLGDFNFGPETDQYRLTAEMLEDSWVLRWPDVDKRTVDFKGEGIDHIFVSPGTTVTDAQYLPDQESDHPAVTARIEW
jgi:endonuclease/exonuclease/phosphatase family metal-dependent hydrolase